MLIFNEKHVPTLGKGTQEKYRLHIVNHIIPEFGTDKLLDITTERIQGFLNKKQKQGLSWWTRNDLRNILSGLFTKAQDFGYWKEMNPAERTTCGRRERVRETKILTDAQLVALLAKLPRFLQLIIRLADSTGMRISEILGLRWESLDLAQGWLGVKERYSRGDLAQPKSESSKRDVPLGDLIEEFRALHIRSGSPTFGFVFCDGQGRPYDDRNLNQHYLRKAAKRLGIYSVGLGFHSFRRGQITGVQELGASSIEAAKMAGHSRPSMTFDYTHMERRRQQELVKRRQARLKTVAQAT